ncbi:MAG: hypothetical protein SOW55_01985 [Bacilli bacterium]|nr:hypothetical protein [Bacillales bacterium]MDY2574740.1 hypothetical protein [Bacilli bacterium]
MKFFNTDGIRAKAIDLISSNLVTKIGQFLASKSKRILIGYDTRESSPIIVDLLINGIVTQGVDIDIVGVCPTPLISYILQNEKYDYGINVTASHNPYYDNGIKIFDSSANKISSNIIEDIKNHLDMNHPFELKDLGKIRYINKYQEYFLSFKENLINNKLKIVFDLSNGAFSSFKDYFYKFNIKTINDEPNGKNINDQVGALFPFNLQKKVKEENFDYGFCFDGDGDRVILVTKDNIYDGDDLIYYLAKELNYQKVVVTKQSNLGLIKALEEKGIDVEVVDIGDIKVLNKMKEENAPLGGEASGHLLFLNHPYSDSLYSSSLLIKLLNEKSIYSFDKYLTFNKNINIYDKLYLQKEEIISFLESKFPKEQLLFRESGTEDVFRIRVQTLDASILEEVKIYFDNLENK